MIVFRVVNILVDEIAVDSCTYSSPLSTNDKAELQAFLAKSLSTYPTAVVECINLKVNKPVPADKKHNDKPCDFDNLFSV